MVETVQSWEVPIAREDDIVLVRRKARALAQERGFDAFAAAALTTAASELARNVWVHAGGGKAIIEELTDGYRTGIRMTFVDEGPGITDVERVLQGGFSTARSLGLGVSGTRRLVEEFDLQTAPGRGTRVVIVKWTRF
ncbi:MAG: anti-sigma regulatory factor [Deltaproteobacteria bacterium]|nr:anti-sigma regulatory factor [Deltaproteobacteria bacterium]